MKTYSQKVLRFDIDPSVYESSIAVLNESISLRYEYDVYKKDTSLTYLKLIWRVNYMDSDNNEILGILITQDHLLELSDINISSLRNAISFSCLNILTKIEDRISSVFLLSSKLDTYSNVVDIGKMLTTLSALR